MDQAFWTKTKAIVAQEWGRIWNLAAQKIRAERPAMSGGRFTELAKASVDTFRQTCDFADSQLRQLLPNISNRDCLRDPEAIAKFLLASPQQLAINAAMGTIKEAVEAGQLNPTMVEGPARVARDEIVTVAGAREGSIAQSITLRFEQLASAPQPAAASEEVVTVKSNAKRKRVILIHGIRTHGSWQKEIATPLSEADFIPHIESYGFFLMVQYLLPFLRARKIRWFRDQYFKTYDPNDPPHVIAHSFGTYIIANALRKYNDIRFDRIILVGSIIPRHFPWKHRFERKQVDTVLNESGGRDLVVRIAEWVTFDAGTSGAKGFECQDDRLIENHNPEFSHSEAFYGGRFAGWLKFLKGEKIQPREAETPDEPNRKPLLTLLLLLVLIGIGVVWWLLRSAPPPPVPPKPVERYTLQDGGVLHDNLTAADWTEADNASDITWQAAMDYCSSKGSGWRLPSERWLRSLYEPGAPRNDCNRNHRDYCHISPKFKLMRGGLWSSDVASNGEAELFEFFNGSTRLFPKDDAADKRALCIKSGEREPRTSE